MRTLENRKIILIGGAGFIGHNLALRLKGLGAEVYVLDSLGVNNIYSFQKNANAIPNAKLYLHILHQRLALLREKKIPFVEVDSRDYDKLCQVIGDLKGDTIIHLAAVAHANLSNKDPHSTFDHSLRTLENALDIARNPKHGISHFIYFSSSMVYGNFTTGMVTEETLCEPLGIYGALKFSGEKIVIAYNQVFGLPYTIVRPSALYGERCVSRRIGQIFIENALNGLDISLNGDGSDRLDFTYIGDLVGGVVKILENENSKNQIFNLTFGASRSISEMAVILSEYFQGIKITYLPKDKLMPARGTLSVEKAQNLIGYQPQYPLEKGFVRYIEWYRTLFDKFKQTEKLPDVSSVKPIYI
ncbi:MAG: NAD(P)-dependent oxidoreductase [Deltaproteobacteria bacterium]|nr:NAD(P)-dependent oxidoreductase [Deltaproteobacteria bacterium]